MNKYVVIVNIYIKTIMFSVVLVASFIAGVFSACDNHCSGHGTCTTDDVCVCYDNWGVGLAHDSADCSERVCPYELAWVDTPDVNGNFHKYMECAGRGICSRDTGECACFDGYEGKACQRSTCPNDCSGHGTCEYIEDLTYRATWNDYQANGLYYESKTFPYHAWDRKKERTCVCDPQYGDFDCSKKMCPYGNDILDARDDQTLALKKQKQAINFYFPESEASSINGKTFALSFKTKLNETFTTIPIVFDASSNTADFANDIQLALLNLPNRVIDKCTVTVTQVTATSPQPHYKVEIEFTGDNVQGPQHLIMVHTYQCLDGCTPKITGLPVETRRTVGQTISTVTETQAADYNSYECGRRGKCDYSTGLCSCFSGYTGDNCNTLHALF